MYSCDILPIPGKQVSGYEEKSSSRLRKPATKFKLLSVQFYQYQLHTIKKDDGRNFYHHSSIYNLKEYKDLTKSPIFFQSKPNELNELQTKVLVTDFQRKVASYLLKKKVNNTKNVQKYYSDVKSVETQQTLLNQSLCLNKYCSGIEVMLMDNNKMIAKQVVPNERLQNRLLKFMEKYLNDDHVDYDLKMQTMTKQYKEIVRKIRTRAFKIRVPDNYQPQMSDYNEYYQVSERQQRTYDQQFDQLADEIIQSLNHSTSHQVTSHKTSKKDLQAYEEEMADEIKPITKFEEEEPVEQEEEEMKKSKKQQAKQPKETKKLTKKQSVRMSRPSFIQRTEEDESQSQQQIQNNAVTQQQQQQQSQANIDTINEEEIKQQIQEIAEELKKPIKKHMTKAEREEQRKRKKEIQRLHEDIERIKREKGEDFEYERTDSDSEERWRRQKLQGQFDDMFKPKHLTRRQSHQLDENEGEDHEYASEQEIEDKSKLERVEQIIQQKKDPNYSYNPQEFWQKEVKINVKRPQLPQLPSQTKQQEQFQQYQKEKAQKQLQALHEKYSTKKEIQQQQPQQQQQQSQQQSHQPSYQQSNQSSPHQQPIQQFQTPQQQQQPQQQVSQKKETQIQLDGYKMPSAFKTPMPSEKQKQSDQSAGFEQSFNLEMKQSTQMQNQQDDRIISSKQLDKQPKKQPQPSQKKSDKNSSVIESKKNLPSMRNLEQDDLEITKKIEEKLQHVQQTLEKVKLGVIEKLLSAPSVYDVEIQEYKLADFPLNQTVFPKLNGDEEKQIFQQLFAWQKEIHQTIPILQQLNRDLKTPFEDEGGASKVPSSDEEDDDN